MRVDKNERGFDHYTYWGKCPYQKKPDWENTFEGRMVEKCNPGISTDRSAHKWVGLKQSSVSVVGLETTHTRNASTMN